MTHRRISLAFWLWALLAGLAGAVIGGMCEALLPAGTTEFSQQQYFHFGLYATGFHGLAGFVNGWLPGAMAAALLVAVACRVGGRRWRLLQVVLPLIAVAGLAVYYTCRTGRWHAFMLAVPHVAGRLRSLLVSPIGLLIPLVVLVLVLWRLRRMRRAVPAIALRSESPVRQARFRWSMVGMTALRGARLLIALLAAVFFAINGAAWALAARARHRVQAQPNIIFIMVDTLRADRVSCYGYDLPTMPNIDRFARGATRFEHAVSQAPYTLWSVISLMSARYPESLFPSDFEGTAGPRFANISPPMLAEVLHDRGYATAAIVSNSLLIASPLTTQGYDSYEDHLAQLTPEAVTSPGMTRAAIERVAALKGRPFFLSLVYMDPHQPYVLHPQFVFGESARDATRRKHIATAYPEQYLLRRKMSQAYDSEIAFTDQHIGQFLEFLQRQGLYDDACIVFFSDHGEELLDHGSWGHRWKLYEEAIQVPLIVKLPHQRQGRVVAGSFPLIDLVPSLLTDLGYDLSPLAMHGESSNLASLLHCADKPIYSTALEGVQSVRQGTLKYIRTFDADDLERLQDKPSITPRVKRRQLFDLASDPLEQRNLLATDPASVLRFAELLQAHESIRGAPEMKGATAADKSLLDRMKSLGYMNPGATPTLVKDKPRD